MRATVASASMLRPDAHHEEHHMLQHPAETLGRLLTAYNDHDAAAFAAQFAHDRVLRTVPTEAAKRWTVTGTHSAEFMEHPAIHPGVELHGCSRLTFTPQGLISADALCFDPATTLRQLDLAHEARRAT
jgi:hypothetical protein